VFEHWLAAAGIGLIIVSIMASIVTWMEEERDAHDNLQ